MRILRFVLLFFGLIAVLGYGGCDETASPPSDRLPAAALQSLPLPACDEGPTVTAVTWNVALGPGMNPMRRPRAPLVAEALGQAEFDVLCLQELWTDGDRDRVVAALHLPPENLLLPDTVGVGENGTDKCGPGQVSRVVSCAREKCAEVDDEDVSSCVKDKCLVALAPIALFDRPCLNCLIATAGQSADEVERICGGKGASRIHGGRTGLLLASRYPLLNRETLVVPATSANRAGLFAAIQVPGMAEPIEVACTHLAASSKDISPYHSGKTSWREEKLAELDMIASRLEQRAGGRPQLLMGDYNIAPRPGTNESSGPNDLWQQVLDQGFVPTPLSIAPSCTSCTENSFRRGKGCTANDHVTVRDPDGGMSLEACSSERLFDQLTVVTNGRGQQVETHLSDHFGVGVTFVAR